MRRLAASFFHSLSIGHVLMFSFVAELTMPAIAYISTPTHENYTHYTPNRIVFRAYNTLFVSALSVLCLSFSHSFSFSLLVSIARSTKHSAYMVPVISHFFLGIPRPFANGIYIRSVMLLICFLLLLLLRSFVSILDYFHWQCENVCYSFYTCYALCMWFSLADVYCI